MNEIILRLPNQVLNQQIPTNNIVCQYDDNYLYNSLKSDEHYYFLNEKVKELNVIYLSLNYDNEAILEMGIDIINNCFMQDKMDIKISKTGENELLIFRKNEGAFNNIIIDESGDIEFAHIPDDWSLSYNEHYPFIYLNNTYNLVSKL